MKEKELCNIFFSEFNFARNFKSGILHNILCYRLRYWISLFRFSGKSGFRTWSFILPNSTRYVGYSREFWDITWFRSYYFRIIFTQPWIYPCPINCSSNNWETQWETSSSIHRLFRINNHLHACWYLFISQCILNRYAIGGSLDQTVALMNVILGSFVNGLIYGVVAYLTTKK